jgi:hypothetical protein
LRKRLASNFSAGKSWAHVATYQVLKRNGIAISSRGWARASALG